MVTIMVVKAGGQEPLHPVNGVENKRELQRQGKHQHFEDSEKFLL